jgi:hypothetical protein
MIARCGKVGNPSCDNTVNSLSNNSVLKKRLGEVSHVVHDDFRPRLRKGENVRGE